MAPPPAGPAPGAATAEPVETKDHARFRGGIRGEGGVLYAPEPGVSLGAIGVAGDVGIQFSDLVGLYWAPSFDIIFGDLGGVNLGSAFMVDFTFDDMFQVGVGPDFGAFAALGSTANGISGVGGELYGARLHFGVIPAFGEGANKVRRKGLILGVDVRMLLGQVGFAELNLSGSANSSGASGTASGTASTTDFILSPMVYIGYQAF